MNRIKLSIFALAAAVPAASVLIGSAAGPNLVANADFSAGVAGWDSFGGNPTAENGTMKITNDYTGTGNSYYSGWYCIPVSPGSNYATSIDYFVPETALDNTSAGLALHYYASTDCSGGNLLTGGGSATGGYTPDQRGVWLTLATESEAPAQANSVRMRVTATKEPQPYSSSMPDTHIVYFDNAYFGLATPPVVEVPNDPPAEPPVIDVEDQPQEPDPAEQPEEPEVPEVPADEPNDDGPNDDEPNDDDTPPYWPPQSDEPLTVPGDPIRDPQPKPETPKAEGPKQDSPQTQTHPEVPAEEPVETPAVVETVEAPASDGDPLPPATGNTSVDRGGASLLVALGSLLAMIGGAGVAAVFAKVRRRA